MAGPRHRRAPQKEVLRRDAFRQRNRDDALATRKRVKKCGCMMKRVWTYVPSAARCHSHVLFVRMGGAVGVNKVNLSDNVIKV